MYLITASLFSSVPQNVSMTGMVKELFVPEFTTLTRGWSRGYWDFIRRWFLSFSIRPGKPIRTHPSTLARLLSITWAIAAASSFLMCPTWFPYMFVTFTALRSYGLRGSRTKPTISPKFTCLESNIHEGRSLSDLQQWLCLLKEKCKPAWSLVLNRYTWDLITFGQS